MRTIEEYMTAKECPALMGTIINIQQMGKMAGIAIMPLKELMKMTGEELHTMQDEILPLYNAAVKKK